MKNFFNKRNYRVVHKVKRSRYRRYWNREQSHRKAISQVSRYTPQRDSMRKKGMERNSDAGLGGIYSILLIVILPVLLTILLQGDSGILFPGGDTEKTLPEEINEKQDAYILPGSENLESLEIPQEELLSILAKEIDPESEEAVLEAQSIIVRTNYAYNQIHQKPQTQGIAAGELMEIWGEQKYTTYFNALERSLEKTEGEVLTYENQLIPLEYHRVSAGTTRSGEENGLTGRPYLAMVESKQDITSENYLKVRFYTTEEFYQACSLFLTEEDRGKTAEELVNCLQVKDRDSAGYAKTVQLGDREMTGEEFKQLLALNSACFYCKAVDDKIRILTKGYGHGYGMSQYGARQLAKEGMSCQEILQVYFPGTVLAYKP